MSSDFQVFLSLQTSGNNFLTEEVTGLSDIQWELYAAHATYYFQVVDKLI